MSAWECGPKKLIIAAAVVFGEKLEADCGRCPVDAREARGCERDSPGVRAVCPCPECRGRGCPECGGKGRLEIRRCPGRTVPRAAWAVCGYAARMETGVLPAPGGWEDQAATWADAVTFVLGERAQYEKQRWDRGKQ